MKQVRMPQNAAPAVQKNTWHPAWEHSKRTGFAASPTDTTTPQENQQPENTRGCRKNTISCETSSNFAILRTSSNRLECQRVLRLPRKKKHDNLLGSIPNGQVFQLPHRRGDAKKKRLETRHVDTRKRQHDTCFRQFSQLATWQKGQVCSFPIDTPKPRENQTREKRQVGEPKQRAVRDFLKFSHFPASKSTFSGELSLEPENWQPQNRCFVWGFRQSTPSTEFTSCRSPANAMCKKHATRHVESAAPATKNDDRHAQSAAPATKTATHLLKTSQKYCACHAKRFSIRCKTCLNVTKSHACHAKRSNDTSEYQKITTSAELPIGTAIWSSRWRLRTVALASAMSSEHTLNPQSDGNPSYAFRKNNIHVKK